MTTKTKTRTKIEVKKEEITEVKCANCKEFHEKDEIMPLNINEDYENNICQYCAESMYNYDTDTTLKHKIIYSLENADYHNIRFNIIWTALMITVCFTLISLSLTMFSDTINKLNVFSIYNISAFHMIPFALLVWVFLSADESL